MTSGIDKLSAARALDLVREGLLRKGAPEQLPERLLVVDAERQVATLIEDGTPVAAWPVSTARRGIGGEEGSFRTPPGWHSIRRRIGEDAAQGAVFVSRQRTGERWCGEARNEDLILTRILTLDGLEDGVNLGPGRDLRSRYIYLHGTNHEDLLGRTASHGCVRLSNRDVTELFERMREGDLVLIAAPASRVLPDPKGSGRFHYAGLAGSGMSALAQFQAMTGGRASGSDRAFDRGERAGLRAELEALGIAVLPQDGSGVGPDCAALVVSTAVEDHVPDVARARELGVPIVHRSELLAHFVATHRSIAITGTSGKSTVTAMVFEILRGAGLEPSVITGGDLPLLQAQGLPGNAFAGASDLLVVEADESDGTLVRYAPAIGVILNLQRDHRETAEVAAMFATLRARTRETLVVGDAETLDRFARLNAQIRLHRQGRYSRRGRRARRDIEPFPGGGRGLHAAHPRRAQCGQCSRRDRRGRRRRRRACRHGRAAGSVQGHWPAISDHRQGARHRGGRRLRPQRREDRGSNQDRAARGRQRVLAIYQPHGYGPTRFLRHDFVRIFASELEPHDRLWMLEVFYAGGTATRDFSAADIVAEIGAKGAHAEFAPSRQWLVARIAEEARPGDLVLLMGARDPSLTELARAILAAIESATASASAK